MTDEELIELGRVGRPAHPGAAISDYLLWFGKKVVEAEREAACKRVQDALFPLENPRGQHR